MIKLLDCTLRDGGYVNDWEFGKDAIIDIKNNLELSGVDIVELGFIRNEKENSDRTVFNSMKQVKKLLGCKKLPNVEYTVMAEVSNPYPLEMLDTYDKDSPEIIRVIVWKRMLKEGFEYCKGIVEKGYKLCVQPARVSQYSDEEFVDMIKMFNELNPMAIYVVDSWGTMYKDELLHYLKLADENLKDGISVGYHGHNNMMQAFDVAQAFCEYNLKRDLIIDASIYGIGRGAGNLNTEIFAKWANAKLGKNYDTTPIVRIYDKYIKEIYEKEKWGYSIPYLITAKYNANPNFAKYYTEKCLDNEVIEACISAIPEKDRVIFKTEIADDILYKIRKSKCSICIIVPTYNRAKHIKFWIEERMHYYYTYGIDVLFVDSSDDDATEKIIKSCKYKNALYERYDDSIRKYKDTIDEKVEYALNLTVDKYDLLWTTRDRSSINIESMYEYIIEAKQDNVDLVTVQDISDKKLFKKYDYTDCNKYIIEQFGNMTSLSATLYFSNFLKGILKNYKIEKGVNEGLWLPVATFHYIANKEFKARFIQTANIFKNAEYDDPSFWLKNKSALILFAEKYPKMIENLPEKYNSEKNMLLTFANYKIPFWSGILLMSSRAYGDYGFFKVIKYRKILKKMAGKYWYRILVISLVPSNVAKSFLGYTKEKSGFCGSLKKFYIRCFRFVIKKVLKIDYTKFR